MAPFPVTALALQVALRKIAHLTYGRAPSTITIVPKSSGSRYVVLVPTEYRELVYEQVTHLLHIPQSTDCSAPVVLTRIEAAQLIKLAC
jgi:hypothetical protein